MQMPSLHGRSPSVAVGVFADQGSQYLCRKEARSETLKMIPSPAVGPRPWREWRLWKGARSAGMPRLPATSGDLPTGRGSKRSIHMGPKRRLFEERGADRGALHDADHRFLNTGLMPTRRCSNAWHASGT